MIGICHLLLLFLNILRMVSGIEQQVCKSDYDDKNIDFNILSGKELKAIMIMVSSSFSSSLFLPKQSLKSLKV